MPLMNFYTRPPIRSPNLSQRGISRSNHNELERFQPSINSTSLSKVELPTTAKSLTTVNALHKD
jgi:hypothetical protein